MFLWKIEGKNITMEINHSDIAFKAPVDGIKYDFNLGARVKVPDASYDVQFIDLTSKKRMSCIAFPDNVFSTKMLCYTNIQINVNHCGRLIWTHVLNLKNRNVRIELLFVDGMGDIIAVMPQIEQFRKRHGCNVYVSVLEKYGKIFQRIFPDICFINISNLDEANSDIKTDSPNDVYATYYYHTNSFIIPSFYDEQMHDLRETGILGRCADMFGTQTIYGYENRLQPTKVFDNPAPCVCISLRASETEKEWNNLNGWVDIIRYLKGLNYRVVCIDGDSIADLPYYKDIIAEGCEDDTGYKPLQDRIDRLAQADFFIGLSSGLSWLAWATGIPVVMISGFTLPYTEFPTPYRVINTEVCHGCFNDLMRNQETCRYDCNDSRYIECNRKISSEMVIEKIRQLIQDHRLRPAD